MVALSPNDKTTKHSGALSKKFDLEDDALLRFKEQRPRGPWPPALKERALTRSYRPALLSICDRHTRKNDKLSHLPAFRRRLRRESPPRSDLKPDQYNRPHQSRSERLFRHEDTPSTHPLS